MYRCIGTQNLRFPVVVDNGVSWSENDDKFALITSKCIYIYDLLANPGNVTVKMNLRLHSIHCSEDVNPWQLNIGIDRDALIETGSTEAMNLMNMDKTVSPLMESGKSSFRQFVRGDWLSPLSLSEKAFRLGFRSDESLFLTLTCDHWLRIYGQSVEDSQWILLKDISEVIHSHLKNTLWKDTKDHNVENLLLRSYAQATVSFLWIPEFKILLLAQKNRDVFVLDDSFSVITVLKDLISTDITNIFAVPQSKDFILLLCGLDGRVLGYKVASKTLKAMPLKKDVWTEADHMVISKILLTKKDSKEVDLILGKGSFLIYVKIEGNEAVVEDSLSMGSTPITGCIQYEEDKRLMVMSLNGPLSSISKDKKVTELNDLGEFLDMEHYMNKGLIKSRCGAMTILVQNVSAYHDHLVLRTPLKLTFLTHFESPVDALDEVMKSPDFSVKNYKDHIEVGRLLFAKTEDEIFIEKEEITDSQFLYWYLQFFKCNQRIEVSDEELEAVQRTLLKSHIQKNPNLKEWMNDENEFKEVSEKCVICGEGFVVHMADHLSCSNDHTFPRCVLTLGVIMTNHMLQCRWCKALAAPDSNPFLKLPCTICGGPFDR